MRRFLEFVFTALLFLILQTPASAHVTVFTEHISESKNNIQILENGDIRVEERIVYDFTDLEKHGIIRKIPYIKENKDGKKFRMDIRIESIKDADGNEYNFTSTTEDGKVILKIGDANRTITGSHTYVITYTVSGAITYFSDHDELYWNTTGTSWEVPIEIALTSITLPKKEGSVFNNVICYTGINNSTDSNCSVNIQGQMVAVSANQTLQSGEGLTIVARFPKDLVSVVEPKEVISFFDTPFGKVVLSILIILGVILGLIWYLIYPLWLPFKWYLHGRDPIFHSGITQARFEGPKIKTGKMLTPAETGTLIDEYAGPHEVSALLIDLAQRGFLKIVEKGKNDFELVKGKEYKTNSSLKNFERVLLIDLFASKHTVRLKDAKLYETVVDVQQKLYESMVNEGLFPKDPQKIRNFYTGMIAAASITFNFLLLLMAAIFGRLMPKKTMEGVQAANEARSLKSFLTSQERQLEFQAKNQMMFEKLLPFAVAFGVEKIWAERFKDIVMKQPDWYVGSTNAIFTSQSFTRSLNSSMSSFSKAATPTTSSSGFSSGFSGGSSGGGGGGGGGGSW
jgi:uncharacterized membrane protein